MEKGIDAQAANSIGLKFNAAYVSTTGALHRKAWEPVCEIVDGSDDADKRCAVGWPITTARQWLEARTMLTHNCFFKKYNSSNHIFRYCMCKDSVAGGLRTW